MDAAAIDKNNVTSQNSERAVGELFELTERLEAALIEHDQKDVLAYLEKLISDAEITPHLKEAS